MMSIAYKKFFNDKKVSELCRLKMNEINREADENNRIGNTLMNRGEYQKAIEHYERAYNTCADNYSNKEDFMENLKLAQAEDLNSKAEELIASKNYKKAIKSLRTAVKLCPADRIITNEKIKRNLVIATQQISTEN